MATSPLVKLSSEVKYPLTLKPTIAPTDLQLYTDIFSLQNTLRILMAALDANFALLEAPLDGKTYGRKDGTWVALP